MPNYKKMHIACDHCGSSDAAVINEDDSKYCFKCNTRDKPQSDFSMPTPFENAVVVASAIGGSSNCTTHLIAIAKHMGIKFNLSNWQKLGHEIPLLVNCQPAGEYLMEKFYRAGGIPAVMKELIKNNKINTKAMTVTGKSVGENLRKNINVDRTVIKTFSEKLADNAGFLVMKGNFFSSAIMKTSVISKEFTKRYLSNPKHPNMFYVKAVVFEGPEDYHKRINNKNLKIDENSILIIRGCGPVGYPGSAEVVNMQPPNNLLKKGINALPTLGDGRQSGTSESPSILHVSPESAIGGDIGIIKTGDKLWAYPGGGLLSCRYRDSPGPASRR